MYTRIQQIKIKEREKNEHVRIFQLPHHGHLYDLLKKLKRKATGKTKTKTKGGRAPTNYTKHTQALRRLTTPNTNKL